jgi:hypothetical protein
VEAYSDPVPGENCPLGKVISARPIPTGPGAIDTGSFPYSSGIFRRFTPPERGHSVPRPDRRQTTSGGSPSAPAAVVCVLVLTEAAARFPWKFVAPPPAS